VEASARAPIGALGRRAKAMIRTWENKGQAVIECLIAAISSLAFSGLLLWLIYFCIFLSHLKYSSHEYLLCHGVSEAGSCEQEFRKNLKTLMIFGKIEKLKLIVRPNILRVHLRFQFQVIGNSVSWNYQDSIQWPVRTP
jgi:hypothetical protein